MPSEASPTLTLWEWLVGTGTMKARIPSTSTTIPTQANGRIYLSVSLIGCHMPHPRCFCLAGDYRTPPKQQKLGWGTRRSDVYLPQNPLPCLLLDYLAP